MSKKESNPSPKGTRPLPPPAPPRKVPKDNSDAVLADVRAIIEAKSFIINHLNDNNYEKKYNVIEVDIVMKILSEHFS